MATTYTYTKELDCCDGLTVQVKRTILRTLDENIPSGLIRYARASDFTVGEYKALSRRNGNTRQYEINITTKAGLVRSGSRLGQAAQAVGSILTPGNVSRVRSPIRSAAWRALTPGLPGGGRGIRRSNRAARCPEGYQYGGRFTDNQLSTCGAQLFDIPSPLGAIIAALRRGPQTGKPTEGQVITGKPGADIIQSRRPQIPRVGNEAPQRRDQAVAKLIEAMGKPDIDTVRMVRQDGFQLQPVVSPAVLRTIPDNRDMEGATYLMSLTSLDNMGGQELGLLSNTGVTNITYVLPNGSSASIQKVRALTVGERRKLGRTVNAAIKKDNDNDPAARLKFLSEETGDGIAYKENLKGKAQTLAEALKAKPSKAKPASKRTIADAMEGKPFKGAASKKIGAVDDAVAHINGGGSLAEIKPSILQEALKQANAFKKRPGGILETSNGDRFSVRASSNDFDHLHASLASEIQQHLGLKSSGVALIGKGGKRRRYMTDAPAVDTNRTFDDSDPVEVARMLLADLMAGIDERTPGATTFADNSVVPTPTPSSLTDLDKIRIVERTEETVSSMRPLSAQSMYNDYYRELRDAQKQAFREELERLIAKARQFNFTNFKDRLYEDGELSAGEKTHLNIIQKIVEGRINTLSNSYEAVIERLDETS